MKRLVVLTLTVLAGGALQALPLGNPSEASLLTEGVCLDRACFGMSIRAGFYGDYVFDRYLELRDGGDIRKTEIYTNAGYLALNFCDRLDLFATIGASQVCFQSETVTLLGVDNLSVQVDTTTDFSWSVGGRGTIWECCGFSLGLEGQYFQANLPLNHAHATANTVIYPDDQNLKYREWQVGLGASYYVTMASCLTAAVPYFGVVWSGAQVDMDNLRVPFSTGAITLADLESRKLWGYAVGVTLVGCGRSSVTVEGRFASERAFYVNGQVRF